jgi:hypothetical protein
MPSFPNQSPGQFALTPALSQRERKNRRQSGGESDALRVLESHTPLLPLPKGEGRGEGNRGILFSTGSGCCNWLPPFGFRISDFGFRISDLDLLGKIA